MDHFAEGVIDRKHPGILLNPRPPFGGGNLMHISDEIQIIDPGSP